MNEFRARAKTTPDFGASPPSFHEPSIANALPRIPPLPFPRGEGRGEGSVLSCWFMVPMRAENGVEAPREERTWRGESFRMFELRLRLGTYFSTAPYSVRKSLTHKATSSSIVPMKRNILLGTMALLTGSLFAADSSPKDDVKKQPGSSPTKTITVGRQPLKLPVAAAEEVAAAVAASGPDRPKAKPRKAAPRFCP